MRPAYDATGMYNRFPLYLVVEDEETRTYLQQVWAGESLIGFYVAGGLGHVQAAVTAARNDGHTHVFGLRDRDFGPGNRARWNERGVLVFVSDACEVENLLLDAEAIARCDVNTANKDAPQIERDMLALARPLVWWMASRRTIAELRDGVFKDFIEHPPRAAVHDEVTAIDAVVQHPWWTGVLPGLSAAWGSRAHVEARLRAHAADYAQMLTTSAWKQEYSGKEILRDLMTRVWTRSRPSDPEGRVTFVQSIARTQREIGRVPLEIRELRTALRARIGR